MPHTFFVDLREPTAEYAGLNLHRGSKFSHTQHAQIKRRITVKGNSPLLRLNGVKFGAARGGVHTAGMPLRDQPKVPSLRPVNLLRRGLKSL